MEASRLTPKLQKLDVDRKGTIYSLFDKKPATGTLAEEAGDGGAVAPKVEMTVEQPKKKRSKDE